MPEITTEGIRNVVLLGHNGCGKTSLADAMLFAAGGTTRLGNVDDETSLSDFEPEERRRGMSIQLSLLPAEWKSHRVNILDTPGYPDFRGETIAAAAVADAAIIVISAHSGVEVGTRQAWELAERFNLPKIVVVNKIDRENVDFPDVCQQVADIGGRQCVPITLPEQSGQRVSGVKNVYKEDEERRSAEYIAAVEAVANANDDLILKYLAGEPLNYEEISDAFKPAFKLGCITPILATAATSSMGIDELLDAIVAMAPSPADAEGDKAIVDRPSNLVFKTTADPYVGKLSMFRVLGAPFESQSQLLNLNNGNTERIAQVFRVVGGETTPVDRIITGDIGVVARLNDTHTYDTLCDSPEAAAFPRPDLPEPVFSLALSPETQADLDKMPEALSRTCDEDPTLNLVHDQETGETVLQGLGDIHLETAIERVKRKFDVSVTGQLPRIAYRETIFSSTRTEYRHKKQSGGHGQYGHVVLQLDPAERGSGITFKSKVVGGNVPKEYLPAVEKGIRKAAADGVIANHEVVDVDVTLLDGSSHSVDSSSMAFEIAASMGFRQGVKEAAPQLLEPVYELKIIVPEDSAGDVITDLNGRRAKITNIESPDGKTMRISSLAPASAVQRYSSDLRSLTQSRGDFMARFAQYEPVPADAVQNNNH